MKGFTALCVVIVLIVLFSGLYLYIEPAAETMIEEVQAYQNKALPQIDEQ